MLSNSPNLCFYFFEIRLVFRLFSLLFLPFGQIQLNGLHSFLLLNSFSCLFEVSCMVDDSNWSRRWVFSALYWELLGLVLEFLLVWLSGSSFSSIQSPMKSRYDPDGFFAYYPLLVSISIAWFSPVFASILVVDSMCLLICFFSNVFNIFVSCFFFLLGSNWEYFHVWVCECENALFLLCHR